MVNHEVISLIPSDFQFQPGKPVSAFNASIYWLQESEATVVLTNNQKKQQFLAHFDDRDGYLSSIDQAYRLANQIIVASNLNTFSAETVEIRVELIQTPVFELFAHEIKFSWGKDGHWRQYECVADDWCQIEHPDTALSSKNVLKPVKRKTLLHKHTMFHSRIPKEQQLITIEAFKETWNVASANLPSYSKHRK